MGWAASAFERRLGAAYDAGDLAVCLTMLRDTELALPLPPHGDPAWVKITAPDRVWLPAYTSFEAMTAATGLSHGRVTSLAELAAGWPDPRWGLAVNAGLPVRFLLEPGTVARLAVPTLAQDHAAEPEQALPVVQKPLAQGDLRAHLGEGEPRVSGYCHHALDVAHVATPAVLLDVLGRGADEGLLTGDGSVFLLRWRTVGLNLYRTPYGGTDEAGMAAMAGWVVEEPPFTGMGLAPNPDHPVREYKVDAVRLPHGSEIVELTTAGTEIVRAVYDGDLGRWGRGGPAADALSAYRARWRGAEYPANPDPGHDGLLIRLLRDEPADGFEERAPGRFVRPVPAAECEAVFHVTRRCEWRGAPCLVREERAGEPLLEYVGGLLPVARALGMERIERGVHRRWVARAETGEPREHAELLDLGLSPRPAVSH
ncbi:SseB family protein [Microbispora sp. H11081]|uniref:SseB family protein n=1 Tax=Microbispora sp. H11081 TaxID=2729107 RepID=UPI00201699CB|nr:SseB family protein [Microbispora sp. H11081]